MPDRPLTIVEPGDKTAAEPVVLVRAVQTCIACPAQWDAWDEQGRYYYLRHRNGRGSVDRFDSPDYEKWPADTEFGQIARFHDRELEYGPEDGDQDLAELRSFCELAEVELAPGFQLTTFEQYIAGRARG